MSTTMESCRTCSKSIASTAMRCPYCGESMPTSSMYVAATAAKLTFIGGLGLAAAVFTAIVVRAIILG